MTAMAGFGAAPPLARARARALTEPGGRTDATMVQREENSLEQTLARTGDGAFVITQDGKIILWNRVAERMLGYTAREAIGRPCCEVLVGRDGNDNRLWHRGCHVMSLVKMADPVQSFDMQTRTKSGRPIWLNFSILTATHGHDGPVTIHLFRDVTATKELLHLVQERLAAPSGAPSRDGDLTRRELEVLRLVATGADTKTAAERLRLSPATVRNHVQNILGKLGVHSRLRAVAYATTHRLL